MIRLPMYKYSKIVKEKFFSDQAMAFFWMFYRANAEVESFFAEDESVLDDQKMKEETVDLKASTDAVIMILEEFDDLAKASIRSGSIYLAQYLDGTLFTHDSMITPNPDHIETINNPAQNVLQLTTSNAINQKATPTQDIEVQTPMGQRDPLYCSQSLITQPVDHDIIFISDSQSIIEIFRENMDIHCDFAI